MRHAFGLAAVAALMASAATAQQLPSYDYGAATAAGTTFQAAPSAYGAYGSYAIAPATYGDATTGSVTTATGSTPAYAGTATTTATATAPATQPGYATTAPIYATPPAAAPATGYAAPAATTGGYATTAPAGYAAPTTYAAPSYGTATYAAPTPYGTIPSPGAPATYGAIAPQPQPAATAPAATEPSLSDADAWVTTLPRYYPAIQACLRRSTAKNPVVANVQEQGNQTAMLIGEGGTSDYSVCTTGLSGTKIERNAETRGMPPAFFAPIGSTFTLSPERPFQPVIDVDQMLIGWLVRTRPAQAGYGGYGSASFDGQFVPPMMVNAKAGRS